MRNAFKVPGVIKFYAMRQKLEVELLRELPLPSLAIEHAGREWDRCNAEIDQFVTGIDFIESAIQDANARRQVKQERLTFRVMDMAHLAFPPASFDVVVSIDTLYFLHDSHLAEANGIERAYVNGAGRRHLYLVQAS